MGEKARRQCRDIAPRRRISNLNVHSESVRGAHEARLSSCRVLSHDAAGFVCRRARRAASSRFGRAGADPGDSACRRDLPGAVSQSGEPVRRYDPGEIVSLPRRSHQRRRPLRRIRRRRLEGLVSPFMPQAATPPAADRFGAQRFPVDGCARSRPGRGAAEAEESRAAARDRAQRRSPPNPSARHLLRHRQGVRALFGDRGRGRLADRHRRDRARNEGPGGGEIAQAPGDRRRPVAGEASGLAWDKASRRRSSASRRAWGSARPELSPARR